MRRAAILVWTVLGGCGDAVESAPIETPPCVDPEILLSDGSCVRPGIPADGCAEGFVHDGVDGCTATLPIETCSFGTMAVPGDAECREVMPCAVGKWGDIPVEPGSIYVDREYTGSVSDGSAAQPWTTIGDAVRAAPSGALIAIAAGTYREDVFVSGKTLRLWGVCPARVEVEGTDTGLGAVAFGADANGSELHGVALRGTRIGLTVSGAQAVRSDRIWVHDLQLAGIALESALGPTSLTLEGSLVERNGIGVYAEGSEATIDASVVRGGIADGLGGRGVSMAPFCYQGMCDTALRTRVRLGGSVVEDSVDVGVLAAGSDLVMEGAVVRRTVPVATDQSAGRGIVVMACGAAQDCIPTILASAIVRGSLLEDNHETGFSVVGGEATLETSVVRTTRPRQADQTRGGGVQVSPLCVILGSEFVCDPTVVGHALVRSSLVEKNHDISVLATNASLRIETSVVRDTLPRASDGAYGDGVAAATIGEPASVELHGTRVEHSPRAGIASFGASASLSATTIVCSAFDLDGEVNGGFESSFVDLGGNLCGCPTANAPCKQVTVGLEPPSAQ